MLRLYIPLLISLLYSTAAQTQAQEGMPGIDQWYAALQVNLYLSSSQSSNTNHLTISASFGTALRPETQSVALWLQSTLNLYNKGLGSSVLDSYLDAKGKEHRRLWQFDWVNSIIGAVELGPRFRMNDRLFQELVTFNQMSASSLRPLYHHQLYYGTHFIWNNHNRNQQIGVFGIHTPWVALNYYNDGLLGSLVCDDYDRFWTGGGMLRVMAFDSKSDQSEWTQRTMLRYQFDRFTHDVQGGYKLSNILLVPNADDPDFGKLLYNNSITSLDVQYGGYSVGISFMGKSKIDVQDAIHRLFGYPLHLTYFPSETLIRFRMQPSTIQSFAQ